MILKFIQFPKKEVLTIFFYFILLLLIGFFIFKNSFNFGLCCDDISVIYMVKAPGLTWNNLLHAFTGPYGSQFFLIFLTNSFFGYNPLYYAITSLLLRVVASLSIFFVSKKLTGNQVVGIVASLWFMVGFAGLESSESILNSSTYIALLFFNMGLIYLFKYYEKSIQRIRSVDLRIAYFMFFLSIASSPIRMHGLLILYPFIEILLAVLHMSKMKQSFIRIVFFIFIIYLLKQLEFFRPQGTEAAFASQIGAVFKPENAVRALAYMFASIYHIISPPSAYTNQNYFYILFSNILLQKHILNILFILSIDLIPSVIFILKKQKEYLPYILISLVWLLFVLLINRDLKNGIIAEGDVITALFGGMIINILIKIVFYLLSAQNKFVFFKLMVLLVFPFSFMVVYYTSQQHEEFVASRYLLVTAEGVYLLFSYVMFLLVKTVSNYKKNDFFKKYVIRILSILLFIITAITMWVNIRNITDRQKVQIQYRKNYLIENAYTTITHELNKYTRINTPLILITTNNPKENADFIYYAITYGGPERIALREHLHSLPKFYTSLQELSKIISENHSLIENVIAFKTKDEQLYPNTSDVREELKKSLPD